MLINGGSRNRIISGRYDGGSCKKIGDSIETRDITHTDALMTEALQSHQEVEEGSAPPPVVGCEICCKQSGIESVVNEKEKGIGVEEGKEQEQEANFQQQKMGQNEEKTEVEEKPISIQDRLVEMFINTEDFRTAMLGMRLCRSCPLVRSADNRDLVWGRELGAGTHGRVSLVFHDLGIFAVKELTEMAGDRERLAAKSEMKTIIGLGHHENVINVYAMDDEISSMPILMEAAVSDFRTAIDTSRFSFHQEAKLLHGAACGLAYMHSCGKVHGDIKPSNILLVRNYRNSNPKTLTAKIADFGSTVDEGEMIRVGTRGYAAPELLRHKDVARPYMDVFSFAVLILQTCVRADVAEAHMFAHSLLLTDAEKTDLDHILWTYPYDLYAMQDLEDLIMERTIADGSFASVILATDKLRPDIPNRNMVCDLLRRCLSPTSTARPTMKQVVEDLSFHCKESG